VKWMELILKVSKVFMVNIIFIRSSFATTSVTGYYGGL
jgi:hypothetical protein